MTPTPANNINDDIDDETPLINRDEKSESSKFKQRKKKEEQKRKKLQLANLIKAVLPVLVRDPDTGELR